MIAFGMLLVVASLPVAWSATGRLDSRRPITARAFLTSVLAAGCLVTGFALIGVAK